ncbi:MAG: hypothetical protein J7J38_03070 [Candidatus Aenigmarchaeota archaeon]|nr:hypothetical protein [Candidatus Aenigmarchaeota archaeon]
MAITKGISPLIATVLLIAFTMAIAGIMATWATSFVQTKITETKNQSEAMCTGVNFRISDARIVDGKGYVIGENLGTHALKDFVGYVYYNDPSKNHDANLTPSNITLESGETYTFTFTNQSANPVEIKVTATNCPSSAIKIAITTG